MDAITIDGMEEGEFRRSVEAMLRNGRADEAASRILPLLEEHCGAHGILPARFLSVSAADISLAGWDRLAERLAQYDRPEQRITAINVDVQDPEDAGVEPDENGRLTPVIATSYFSDSAFPFSDADREDLLEGYSHYGCQWQGDYEHTDATLTVEGIDDLYGAVVDLENKVIQSARPSREDIRAGAIGACYIGVLIHIAVREAVRREGLPRPLCVMAGSNDTYPFFDAPVMTASEYLADGQVGHVASGPRPIAFTLDDDEELHLVGAFDNPVKREASEEGPSLMGSLENCGLVKRKTTKKAIVFADAEDAAAALFDSIGDEWKPAETFDPELRSDDEERPEHIPPPDFDLPLAFRPAEPAQPEESPVPEVRAEPDADRLFLEPPPGPIYAPRLPGSPDEQAYPFGDDRPRDAERAHDDPDPPVDPIHTPSSGEGPEWNAARNAEAAYLGPSSLAGGARPDAAGHDTAEPARPSGSSLRRKLIATQPDPATAPRSLLHRIVERLLGWTKRS